jgi:hypothetical protein
LESADKLKEDNEKSRAKTGIEEGGLEWDLKAERKEVGVVVFQFKSI